MNDQKAEVRGQGSEIKTMGPQDTRPGDEMLNKRELAARLKITVRTVENWQRRGVLVYIKVDKVVLFHWPDVVAHLKSKYLVSRRSLRIRREVVMIVNNNKTTTGVNHENT